MVGGDFYAMDRIAGVIPRSEWPADVLICDVGLPDDDGYGLLRRLRALPEGERVPAIALTAYARSEDRTRSIAENADQTYPRWSFQAA